MVIFYHYDMYYFSVTDQFGFIHSVDNVVLNYYLHCSVDTAVKRLQELRSNRKNYWEKLNCSGCPKWSFYQNHIHYDDGIYLKIGHYTDYDAKKKMYRLIPMLSLEVNPNKHSEKDSFQEILQFIKEYCQSGDLIRYDYAIDIPLKQNDIQVFKTRKQCGLYKGTRYYGIRNNHGYCRIYDKGKEQNLDTPLTRVEHVLVAGKKLSLETFYYLSSDTVEDLSGLTPNNRAIVMLARQVKALGGDYSSAIGALERHARAKLETYLSGGFVQYKYDLAILDKLLKEMKRLFFLDDSQVVYEDAEGFLQYDGDVPFD